MFSLSNSETDFSKLCLEGDTTGGLPHASEYGVLVKSGQ